MPRLHGRSTGLAVLVLAVVLLRSAAAAKVTYISGPLGVGPDNNPDYVKGRRCGQTPADIAWDKQLGRYNDSSYSGLSLKPVTEVRTRWAASLQMAWGATEAPEHGFRNTLAKPQERVVLRPGEVIVKVTFQARADGLITNLTFYTNMSRVWKPYWPLAPDGSATLYSATPPAAADWKGRPVVGDWYLAYTYASIVGWCHPQDPNSVVFREGPGYYFTPVLYFVWAADTACSCPNNYDPVCDASGKKTWTNACNANCHRAARPFKKGACDPCVGVPRTYAPVCGKNGKTYHNKQLLKCSKVELAYIGPCRICPKVKKCLKAAVKPVCGADRKTYCNACTARARQVRVLSTGYCKTGTCLPTGSPCLLANPKCCKGLTCWDGPVARAGAVRGTCRGGPLPIG